VFWAIATVAMLLMTCGPFVSVTHPMFDGTQGAHDLRHTPVGAVPGPYLLAMKLVPMLRFFRAPYRWITIAEISVATLAALGIAGLRARLGPTPARRIATAAILVGIVGLGAVDTRPTENTTVESGVVPDAYAVLRDDPEPAAVIELPSGITRSHFGNLASRYMFFQTAHRKYLLDGSVARLPRGARPLIARHFDGFADLPWVKYVVIHRDLMDTALPAARTQVAEVDALLGTLATLVRADGPIEIYRLSTFRPESVR